MRRGFTLVELLIGIVVIAILAAISIVAYNGIQNRAEATRAANTAAQLTKLIKLFHADNGRYPASIPDVNPHYGETCFGTVSDFPAGDGFAAGQCLYNTDDPFSVSVSSNLMDDISDYGTLPNVRIKTVRMANEYWRGIRYFHNPYTGDAILTWAINGNYPNMCGPDAQGSASGGGPTYCEYRMSP